MPDPDDLHRLAPHVDSERASAAFQRRRRQVRSYRRGAWAAGAMVLVVGASAVVASMNDDTPVRTTPAAPTTGQVDFEVLGRFEATEAIGTVQAAVSEDGFLALAERTEFVVLADPLPSVDFTKSIVVSMTVADDACPPELADFARAGDVISPVFVEPNGGCDGPLDPKTFVVRLSREGLGSELTLHLPGDEASGFEDQDLVIPLDGRDLTVELRTAPGVLFDSSEVRRVATTMLLVPDQVELRPAEPGDSLTVDLDVIERQVGTQLGSDGETELFLGRLHEMLRDSELQNRLVIAIRQEGLRLYPIGPGFVGSTSTTIGTPPPGTRVLFFDAATGARLGEWEFGCVVGSTPPSCE